MAERKEKKAEKLPKFIKKMIVLKITKFLKRLPTL